MSGCPHFDLTDPDTYHGGQPRETYKYLRQEQPVYWHEDPVQGVGFWVITRQADLDFVSKNPLLFSSRERSCLPMEPDEETLPLMQTQMINMDPPQHLKYRRLVRTAFTPKAVDSYHDRFKEVAKDIVDRAIVGGRCEFVEDVSAELPLIAICELMGVPLDKRKRLYELTNIMLGMDDPELSTTREDGTNAMIEMFMLAMEVAQAHKEQPQNDIVNVLLTGTVEDEPLTEEEFCNFLLMLMVAGNETTTNLLGITFVQLRDRPEVEARVRADNALIPKLIEEVLRYDTPVQILFRHTLKDAELAGVKIPEGSLVLPLLGSGNRDETQFDTPDQFNIDRKPGMTMSAPASAWATNPWISRVSATSISSQRRRTQRRMSTAA